MASTKTATPVGPAGETRGELEALKELYASSSDEEEAAPLVLPVAHPTGTLGAPAADDDEDRARAKRAKASALPDAADLLGDLGAGAADPHHGRIRQFAHVDGDFSTLVYIPVRSSPALLQQIGALVDALRPLSGSTVHRADAAELHISLSRSFTLRRAQLQPFIDALKRALRPRRSLRLCASSLEPLANESKTCFFGALVARASTQADEAEARSLLGAVDAVLVAFQKQPFYQPPTLHFSVAWSLAPFCGRATREMALPPHEIRVDRVLCKLGARIEEFVLRS